MKRTIKELMNAHEAKWGEKLPSGEIKLSDALKTMEVIKCLEFFGIRTTYDSVEYNILETQLDKIASDAEMVMTASEHSVDKLNAVPFYHWTQNNGITEDKNYRELSLVFDVIGCLYPITEEELRAQFPIIKIRLDETVLNFMEEEIDGDDLVTELTELRNTWNDLHDKLEAMK